jgi:glucosamine--fructose-6-phosphate aminotransferase (isomerizing)
MLAQVLAQPETLRALLARRDEVADVARRFPARTIWACGHGDSYFAPLAAAPAFRRFCRRPYVVALAQEFAAYPPDDLDRETLVVVLSMSGGVGRSVAAARVARARGARVLAVTNTPGSPLAEAAHQVLALGVPESAPFLAGTATYVASVLAMLLLALFLDAGADGVRSAMHELERAVDALAEALQRGPMVREAAARASAAPAWYLLGMEGHVATAHYGAAKLLELADVLSIAQETEEFFHEHHWVVSPSHQVVLLVHDKASARRSASAAAHLRELGVPAWWIGPGPAPEGVVHVPLPTVATWCAPLPGAVPLQWLAYWLARAKGLDPDRRTHLREHPRYVVSRRYRMNDPGAVCGGRETKEVYP